MEKPNNEIPYCHSQGSKIDQDTVLNDLDRTKFKIPDRVHDITYIRNIFDLLTQNTDYTQSFFQTIFPDIIKMFFSFNEIQMADLHNFLVSEFNWNEQTQTLEFETVTALQSGFNRFVFSSATRGLHIRNRKVYNVFLDERLLISSKIFTTLFDYYTEPNTNIHKILYPDVYYNSHNNFNETSMLQPHLTRLGVKAKKDMSINKFREINGKKQFRKNILQIDNLFIENMKSTLKSCYHKDDFIDIACEMLDHTFKKKIVNDNFYISRGYKTINTNSFKKKFNIERIDVNSLLRVFKTATLNTASSRRIFYITANKLNFKRNDLLEDTTGYYHTSSMKTRYLYGVLQLDSCRINGNKVNYNSPTLNNNNEVKKLKNLTNLDSIHILGYGWSGEKFIASHTRTQILCAKETRKKYSVDFFLNLFDRNLNKIKINNTHNGKKFRVVCESSKSAKSLYDSFAYHLSVGLQNKGFKTEVIGYTDDIDYSPLINQDDDLGNAYAISPSSRSRNKPYKDIEQENIIGNKLLYSYNNMNQLEIKLLYNKTLIPYIMSKKEFYNQSSLGRFTHRYSELTQIDKYLELYHERFYNSPSGHDHKARIFYLESIIKNIKNIEKKGLILDVNLL